MSFQLVGQSLSALVSTSFQNVSASRRCHSFTEAVHLALLSFLGLISSFHNVSPISWIFLFFVFMAVKKPRFFRNLTYYTEIHLSRQAIFPRFCG